MLGLTHSVMRLFFLWAYDVSLGKQHKNMGNRISVIPKALKPPISEKSYTKLQEELAGKDLTLFLFICIAGYSGCRWNELTNMTYRHIIIGA